MKEDIMPHFARKITTTEGSRHPATYEIQDADAAVLRDVPWCRGDLSKIEWQIMKDGKILVTTRKIIIGGVTHLLANATSIRSEVKPKGAVKAGLTIIALTTIALFVVGIVHAVAYVCLPLVVLSALWLSLSEPVHAIRLGFAGGEVAITESTDAKWVALVVDAITTATSRRSV